VVEGADGEVRLGETLLRQQRAENEHGVVAALPGLDKIDAWQVGGPGFGDPRGALPLGRPGGAQVGIVGERGGDCLFQVETLLGGECGRRQGQQDQHEGRSR
jgi:hypothetical protein